MIDQIVEGLKNFEGENFLRVKILLRVGKFLRVKYFLGLENF